MEYAGVHTQLVTIFGADDHYMEIQGGSLPEGRFFTTAELRTGTPVVVIERRFADKLFGRISPMGRLLRISGKAFQVIGVYLNPENIFQPPSQEIAAIIPFEAARRFFRSEEHTSERQSLAYLVCRLLLEKKKKKDAQRKYLRAATILDPA